MGVEDALTRPGPGVKNGPIIGDSQVGGNISYRKKEFIERSRLFERRSYSVLTVKFRNYQNMSRCLRGNVIDGKDPVVLKDLGH